MKYIPVPLIYGTGQGRSATFSNAQGNESPILDVSFFVYRVSNYQVVSITNELLEATKDDAGAFIDSAKLAMDTGFRNLANDMALDLFSDGSGSRGQISTIVAGVIVLDSAQSVVNFEVGMALVSYQVAGNVYTQSTGAAIGYVIAVDRSNGIVTVSATVGGAAGTPANWSAANFPFLGVQGDVAFGTIAATTSFLKMSGLGAWLPVTAPVLGTDSFWGVDRGADPTRLGGVRYDGQLESIEEALTGAAALVSREGGRPNFCFMNFTSYKSLLNSLGSKVQYVEVKHDVAEIAFESVLVHGPYGKIHVIPDRSCPANTGYLLDMKVWKLRSLGKAPHVLSYGLEGLEGARIGDSDALQIRLGFYGNLICSAPGWNCVVQLSA